jgi:hypothetical protein
VELPNGRSIFADDAELDDITHVAVNDGGDVIGYRFGDTFIRAISGGAESGGDDAGDGDGEGDGEEEGEDSEDEEEEDDEEDEGEGKEKPKSKVKPKPKEKPDDKITLTEARLKSRLKRARDGSVRGLAKELGFDSVDELKAAIAAKSGKPGSGGATRTRAKTEKESGSGKSDDSEDTDAVRRLRTDNAALSAKLRLNTLQVAVEREAAKMGFIDPEDAFRLADFGDGEEFMDDKDKADSEAIPEVQVQVIVFVSQRRRRRGWR